MIAEIVVLAVLFLVLAAIMFNALFLRRRHRPQPPVPPLRGDGISLLVPFVSDRGVRLESWQWLREYWRHELPGAQICVGTDFAVPFCKTAAVNEAAAQASGDVFVILDADCYMQASVIEQCAMRIRAARSEGRKLWFIPYRRFYRLTRDASRRLLASRPDAPLQFPDPPPPDEIIPESKKSISHGHWFAALIQILPREAFFAAGGMDERFCVDAETEILTRDGWKSCDQLHANELALTLDHETGLSQWQPVLAVNKYEGRHEMLSIESKTHSSLTTLNHCWPVVHRPDFRPGNGWGSRKEQRSWTTSATFKSEDQVPIAAECAELPAEPTYSDAVVQLAAWFWTEGSVARLRNGRCGRRVSISQSWAVNPFNCEKILLACASAFGTESLLFPRRGKSAAADQPRWRAAKDRSNVVAVLNAEAGDVLQKLAPGRVPSYEFLNSLTKEQLELFIETSLLADGHTRRASYERSLGQKNTQSADAFQYACILAGHPTSIRTGNRLAGYGYGMTLVRIRQQRRFKLAKGRHAQVTYEGTAWCPTTANGTWLARRRGKVYFTGNSGWGGEDIAFMRAVDTMYAKHKTTSNGTFHVWHPVLSAGEPHLRMWEGQPVPRANDWLSERYASAFGDRFLMQQVIDQARSADRAA